MQMPIN